VPLERQPTWSIFCVLAILTPLISMPCLADVPTPPNPPPVPAGYCSTIYGELWPDLQAFNTLLQTPPSGWTPIGTDAPLFSAHLKTADGNTGLGLIGSNYINTVLTQIQEERSLGITAMMVQIGFPAVYEPFLVFLLNNTDEGDADFAQMESFYAEVAQAIHGAGMKLIVENNVLLTDDVSGGWGPGLNAFYASPIFTGPYGWGSYMAARATMAATLAQVMQPDYLVLGEEPEGEEKYTGQQNMFNAADAALMIAGEAAAVAALNLPNPPKLGAGAGTWTMPPQASPNVDYIADYAALPGLDYVDFHLYPINTEQEASFIDNTLLYASIAANAGKPVAMSEGWLWKMENSEWGVLSGDDYRARDPFSFWSPIDAYYLQTVQALGNYANLLYVSPEGADQLFDYQTYGGTVENGGAVNCTCTTESCSDYDVVHAEGPLTQAANASGDYSGTGLSYNAGLVTPPDTIPPSTPAISSAKAGYYQATVTWNPSSDNVGVVGYNLYQCAPPVSGGPCTGVYIGQTSSLQYNSTGPTIQYTFTGLNLNTVYNFQVQAFDLANNNSPLSAAASVQTMRVAASTPTGLVARAVSPTEIDLNWDAPADASGLSKYLIFNGPSSTNLTQISPGGTTGATTTTYTNRDLQPGTTYYYGVESVEKKIDSAMSPTTSATTLPLPNPPSNLSAAPTPTTIVLTWDENTLNGALPVASYKVSVGSSPGVYTNTYTVKAPTTSYTARSLTPGTTYYFQVVAVDDGTPPDDSLPSNELPATTLPAPPPPTGLQDTTPAATQIAFTWSWAPLTGGLPFARFLIDCGPTRSDPPPPQVGVTTAGPPFAYTWRGALAATKYYCQVVAVDKDNNQSEPSSQITITTPPDPAAPVNVTGTAISSTEITVTWTENVPPNGLPISTYSIWRATATGGFSQLPNVVKAPATSFTDKTVSAGTTYYYEVTATDTGRDVSPKSAPSPPVTP